MENNQFYGLKLTLLLVFEMNVERRPTNRWCFFNSKYDFKGERLVEYFKVQDSTKVINRFSFASYTVYICL